MEFPSGAVPLNSHFYVERPPVEAQAYAELKHPGSLIRIRAPKGMGKRSLLLRLLDHATEQGYRKVSIDFHSVDQETFRSLNRFLRWFCAEVSRQLQLPAELDLYWDEDIGAKLSCTIYFESYLLSQLSTVAIALNHVESVFEHPAIAQEFLPMLRYWHEYAKQSETFQKIRLIVSHATEIYVPLRINQSPFNIGVPIQLSPFTPEQIQTLTQHHDITLSASSISHLMAMVGGHPQLIRTALYYLKTTDTPLDQLLAEAPTQSGIYRQALQQQLITLQQQPDLAASFRRIVNVSHAVELDPIQAYRLESLGLVKLKGDRCEISCELYRQYFRHQNLAGLDERSFRLVQLERENQKLHRLAQIDGLTQVANRRCFDQSLEADWHRMAIQQDFLSILLLDIDCFKAYNDTYGHQAGDDCLQKAAQVIQRCVRRPTDLVARYGGEEFAVLLPQTKETDAMRVAQNILQSLRSLNLCHESTTVGRKVVTVSIGVAGLVPQLDRDSVELLRTADQALYASKHAGRDRCTSYQAMLVS